MVFYSVHKYKHFLLLLLLCININKHLLGGLRGIKVSYGKIKNGYK
jgi:hypothetical protein